MKDILAGLLLIAAGLYFSVEALGYGLGTLQRMGPGYFPFVVGGATAVVGLMIMLPALRKVGAWPEVDWRPLLAVGAGICAFWAGFRYLGLVPAVFATVAVSSLGNKTSRPLGTVAVAGAAAIGAWLLFVVVLGQTMPVFRRPF